MDPNAPKPQLSELSVFKRVKNYFRTNCPCNASFLASIVMTKLYILSWLPKYKSHYLYGDIMAGVSVVILCIPQGLAYGMLSSLQPSNGLYVSFFPVLIYVLLGTSRHASLGTMAVIALIVAGSVNKVNNLTPAEHSGIKNFPPSNLEIATTLSIEVGIIQVLMGVFHFGILTVVFSDPLVSGLIVGASVHVATAQWKNVCGIPVKEYSGNLQIIYIYGDVFRNLRHSNFATLLLSVCAVIFLLIFKATLDEPFFRKTKMAFPVDLILVILATLFSYLVKFYEKYGIDIIGQLPSGLPSPDVPRFDICSLLIWDSFAICVVSYAITLSMAKVFAAKHKYEIDADQEFFAIGCSNIFSSFFACFPCSASLSRTVMQDKSGGKTQIASLVSCVVMLIVLYLHGRMINSLPKCILSCIILVALRSFFEKIKDFKRYCKVSYIDGSIWMIAFLGTVFADVTSGLFIGIGYSLLTVIVRVAIPSRILLGHIPEDSLFLDQNSYEEAQNIVGIHIYQFQSPLCFINKGLFRSSLEKHVPLKYKQDDDEDNFEDIVEDKEDITCIIIDCSYFSFVDVTGLVTLLLVMKTYHEVGIVVYLVHCSTGLQRKIMKSNFIKEAPYQPFIFHTIQDAIDFHEASQSGSN